MTGLGGRGEELGGAGVKGPVWSDPWNQVIRLVGAGRMPNAVVRQARVGGEGARQVIAVESCARVEILSRAGGA